MKTSLSKILLPLLLFLFIQQNGFTQAKLLRGTVKGIHNEGGHNDAEPLPFANVYWSNTTTGVITDETGKFIITKPEKKDLMLIVSFVGFKSDTLLIPADQNQVNIVLKPNTTLSEVVIKDGENGNYISKIKPIKTEVITTDGLQKLACCNLSESFEGTATVDVGYSDAVSGAKRIQMLGLSGIYSQLLTETMPAVRGLSSAYGLTFIPGSWMQSIQISKGTSSVINGYESITGQINVEYKKPEHSPERFFLNLYGNSDTRAEANILSSIKLNDNWSTMILANGSYNGLRIDHNHDSFLDIPTGWSGNIMNRWSYEKTGVGHIQFGVNVLEDMKDGGQIDYYEVKPELKPKYRIGIENRHYTAFLKSGFFFGQNTYKSLGLVATGNRHEMRASYGINKYTGVQNSAYLNLIYQSVFGNTNHKYSTGASFMFDNYLESLNDSSFNHTEYVPGAFFEYTYTYPEKLSIITGIRADYNSEHGIFITPRLHIKWDVTDLFIIRASAGRGYRSPNVVAENTSILATSRTRYFADNLKAEEAWNYGINFTKEFLLSEKRKASLGMDFYRTDFVNQVVVDFDKNPQQVLFYNLDGKSYANSLQLDGMIQPIDRFEITLAGRFNYVKKTIDGKFVESPYISKYKALMTLSYYTRFEKWKFDVTAQYNGKSRLPSTASNPEMYSRPDYSKPYFMLYAQITKKWKRIDIYAGVENITNYKQHHPIIAADDSFGKYFDASMIWGPIMGRTIYAGLRLSIK